MDGPSRFVEEALDFFGFATGILYLWLIYVYVM